MSNLSEQFSAVREAQIQAQFRIFDHFSARAVENTEKLLALNMHVTRAALDQTAAAVRRIIDAEDPRDLLSLTTQGQQQFDSILAYGRALIGIAAGAPAAEVLAIDAAAPATPAPFPTVEAAQDVLPAPRAAKKK